MRRSLSLGILDMNIANGLLRGQVLSFIWLGLIRLYIWGPRFDGMIERSRRSKRLNLRYCKYRYPRSDVIYLSVHLLIEHIFPILEVPFPVDHSPTHRVCLFSIFPVCHPPPCLSSPRLKGITDMIMSNNG